MNIKSDVPNDVLTVRPNDNTPDTLYYGDLELRWMGGTILIVDSIPSTTSVASDQKRGTGEWLTNVYLYPNPTSTTAYIQFTAEGVMSVDLAIYDALGRNIQQVPISTTRMGQNVVTVDVSDLQSGIYFYRIVGTEPEGPMVTGQFQVLH